MLNLIILHDIEQLNINTNPIVVFADALHF